MIPIMLKKGTFALCCGLPVCAECSITLSQHEALSPHLDAYILLGSAKDQPCLSMLHHEILC